MSEPSIKDVILPQYHFKGDYDKALSDSFRELYNVDGENERELRSAISEIDDLVDKILDQRDYIRGVLDIANEQYGEALESIDSLLQFCPHYILIDKHKLPLADALAWVRENAEGDYQSFKINNLYGIVFTDETDLTLFKVKFL